jgi:hypothetical protein
MRMTAVATFVVILLALSGCGSGGSFANKPRPATPVNLTVYINNSSVSLSPTSVGAGQVVFYVTNQANKAESLSIHRAGQGSQLASTGPINPQGTSQVAVDFTSPGDYMVSTSAGGSTDAAQSSPGTVQPASLHVSSARSNSSNQLLQP